MLHYLLLCLQSTQDLCGIDENMRHDPYQWSTLLIIFTVDLRTIDYQTSDYVDISRC